MSAPFEAPADDLDLIKATAEEHGFCLVKRVFTPEEMGTFLSWMREDVRGLAGRPQPDNLSMPRVRQVYFHPRILAIMRTLVGPTLVYDGEGNMNFEEQIGSRTLKTYNSLHCDAWGMPEDLDRQWSSPTGALYRGYRCGIYFQDYRESSGALKVVVGSHRGDPGRYKGSALLSGAFEETALDGRSLRYPLPHTPLFNFPSEPGDLVVWSLRTFHAAGAKIAKSAPRLAFLPTVEDDIARAAPELLAPPPGPRNVLFFDYGAPCEEMDLYIKWRSRPTAKILHNVVARAYDDPALLKIARENGIELRLDSIIVGQSIWLASAEQGSLIATEKDKRYVRERLGRALQHHREYSPYFPLIPADLNRDAVPIETLVDGMLSKVAKQFLAPA